MPRPGSAAPGLRRTRADLVADAIRRDIMDHVLAPGQALPQELLAERYEVSRIPLREALRRLEAEGFVALNPFRGAVVAELSDEDGQEIIELRVALMQLALPLSVPNLTEADLRRAARSVAAMRRAKDLVTWGARANEFYSVLCGRAGRPRLLGLLKDLQDQSQRYRLRAFVDPNLRALFERGMQRALVACRRGDVGVAMQLLENFMNEGLARFLKQVDARPPKPARATPPRPGAPSRSPRPRRPRTERGTRRAGRSED